MASQPAASPDWLFSPGAPSGPWRLSFRATKARRPRLRMRTSRFQRPGAAAFAPPPALAPAAAAASPPLGPGQQLQLPGAMPLLLVLQLFAGGSGSRCCLQAALPPPARPPGAEASLCASAALSCCCCWLCLCSAAMSRVTCAPRAAAGGAGPRGLQQGGPCSWTAERRRRGERLWGRCWAHQDQIWLRCDKKASQQQGGRGGSEVRKPAGRPPAPLRRPAAAGPSAAAPPARHLQQQQQQPCRPGAPPPPPAVPPPPPPHPPAPRWWRGSRRHGRCQPAGTSAAWPARGQWAGLVSPARVQVAGQAAPVYQAARQRAGPLPVRAAALYRPRPPLGGSAAALAHLQALREQQRHAVQELGELGHAHQQPAGLQLL
jgi:hypothetical protein